MSEFFHAIDSGSWEKPEVFGIAQRLSVSQGDAFLACLSMWDYFRRNSTDGSVSGVTPAVIDRQVRLNGFAEAAIAVKWLEVTADGLRQPGFAYHLHGCESLKAFRHRNRAKKSNDKQALLEAIRSIDPDAANLLESKDAHGIVREKRNQSKTESKTESKPEKEILTERNGSRSRAVPEFGNSKTQSSELCDNARNSKTQSSELCDNARNAETRQESDMPPETRQESDISPINGPASVKLPDIAKMPLLARLDGIRVEPGKPIFGSVFSPDRLKREDIDRADSAYWLGWYRDQLACKSPILRCGNMAEAVYVLAAVYAAKRAKGVDNKLALWIKWVKVRECGSITESDWKRAAERLEAITGNSPPPSRTEPQPASAAPVSQRTTKPRQTLEQARRALAQKAVPQ